MIGLLKRCLESTMANRRFTLGKLSTVVVEATQLVNSRPIARNTGDPETGGPITPLHLMLGRASVEVPRLKFHEAPRLTQRLQFIADAKEQFWKKWKQQVFSGRMLSHKWVKMEGSVPVGDFVSLAEAENEDPTYRLGVVEEAKPGEDGCVGTVSIRYTNQGKEPGRRSPHNITTRPIHKIAVIVLAGYVFEDDTGGGEANLRRPRHRPGVKEEADAMGVQEGGPAREAGPEEPEKAEPRPASRKGPGRPKKSVEPEAADREAGGGPQPAIKRRPVRHRKKLAAGSDGNTADKAGGKRATQGPGEQQQTLRRRRFRDLTPKG